MSDKYADEANTIASKKMFDMVGIKYRIYRKNEQKINDRIIRTACTVLFYKIF